MNHDELMALIRRAGGVSYESPTRGAVCLARLSYGLPESELVVGVSDAERANTSILRTIAHPHRHQRWLDQFGDGEHFELERDVTVGGRRWTFKVTVHVDQGGTAVIADADVARPEEGDEVDGAEPPAGILPCPCCGRATLSELGGYDICPVCFWEDDGQDNADADVDRGGSNRISLTTARRNYLAFGASDEQDRASVRPPTDEEVALRYFDADGREIQPGH